MKGWETKKLGDVYDVRDGTHDSPKYYENGYPLITSKNLKSNGLIFDNVKYISENDYKKINERSEVHKGDVLFAMIGTIGNPIVVEVEPDFAIKNVALFKVSQNQDSYFLKYYLQTDYVQSKMQKEAKGSTQKFVGLGYLRNFPIAIPPLPEQKRIVTILDEAFEGIDRAIANTEKNLANSRELFESYLNGIFTQKGDGWTEKKLKDLINISHGYAFKGSDFAASDDVEKLIVLTPGNYSENGELYFTSKNTKRLRGGSPPDGYLFNIGDLTVVMTDLSSKMKILGKPAFIERPNILHNQRIGRIIFRDKSISPRYLFYFFRTEIFANKIKETATGTMVRHTAPQRILSNKIPIPKYFDRQLNITSKLDQIASQTQRLETIYRQKLAALKELKQSILQKAFTGELTTDTAKTAKEEIAA